MDLVFNMNNGEVCRTCGFLIFDLFKTHGKPIADYEKYVKDLKATSTDNFTCILCEEDIISRQEYHKLTVPHEVTLSLADVLGEDIKQCEYCLQQEIPFMGELGLSGRSVSEHLSSSKVPDELLPALAELVRCSSCGYGREAVSSDDPMSGIFKLTDDIYTECDILWGFDDEQFSKFAEQYGEYINEKGLLDLKNHLKSSPLFAFEHPVGKSIYKVLQDHFELEEYTVVKQGEQILYRGRTREKQGEQLKYHQLGAAPLGKPSHGRYNAIGVPVFYATDNIDMIPYELRPQYHQVIDVGTFEITKKEFKLFDIGHFDSYFAGFFNEINEDDSTLKESYLLPNFIGACCNKIGYDGVVYLGVHQDDSSLSYTNYALFKMEIDLDLTPSADVESYDLLFNISMKGREEKKISFDLPF